MKSSGSDDEDMAPPPPPGADITEFSASSDRESLDEVAEVASETVPHTSVGNSNVSCMVVDDEDEEMESVQTGVSSDSFDFIEDSEDEEDGCVVVAENRISRSFDMKLLRQSIVDGSRILEDVKGKEVVMVLGKTGTGKSTLIQALAGKKMSASTYTTIKFEETIEKSVFEAEDPLTGFEIGHVKSSKTRHMNGYAAMYKGKDGTTQELIYIDSPGFEDTEGPEIDIATSAMMSQVAKKCIRLRFVVMINYASLLEDRGGAMRGVLKLTRNFVKDFEETKTCFMFLFTHTNEIKGIPENSVKDAKVILRREIIRTIEGTSTMDREVLQVLTFLRVCLEKDYRFVDVSILSSRTFPL
jgi:energy-coupling factor transporter ATP-binding protein EcfA2